MRPLMYRFRKKRRAFTKREGQVSKYNLQEEFKGKKMVLRVFDYEEE